MIYIEIKTKAAREYILNRFNPFEYQYKLTDVRYCYRCEQNITVGDYKLEYLEGDYYVCCPNAPKCSGTIIHWHNERKERLNK
jgi:hypothetical protein